MLAVSDALYATMAADAALTGLLGTFGAGPAILTQRPVPETATRPLVLAVTVVSDVDADLIASQGREIMRDIGIYGTAPAQFAVVCAAAERIRALFHRQRIAVAGWHTVSIRARGPIDAPADPGEVGRIVTLLIRLHQV